MEGHSLYSQLFKGYTLQINYLSSHCAANSTAYSLLNACVCKIVIPVFATDTTVDLHFSYESDKGQENIVNVEKSLFRSPHFTTQVVNLNTGEKEGTRKRGERERERERGGGGGEGGREETVGEGMVKWSEREKNSENEPSPVTRTHRMALCASCSCMK